MAREFKVGDIVQLKSGSPKLTIDEVHDEIVWAVWFAGAKRERAFFNKAALDLVPNEPVKK